MVGSLIFVDSRVPQTETLLRHLPHGALVSRIGAKEDALDHIASRLSGTAGIDNLLLIAHGAPGALYLGETPLTAAASRRVRWARLCWTGWRN